MVEKPLNPTIKKTQAPTVLEEGVDEILNVEFSFNVNFDIPAFTGKMKVFDFTTCCRNKLKRRTKNQ